MMKQKWDHSQVCEACKAIKMIATNCDHFRGGKTTHERQTGVLAQRLRNQDIRSAWCKETIGNRSKFPSGTCNGKRNRFRDAPR